LGGHGERGGRGKNRQRNKNAEQRKKAAAILILPRLSRLNLWLIKRAKVAICRVDIE